MRLFDRLRTEPVYNTRAVVQRTTVPADTFRAWERRYGIPAPARTAGNQRLYSDRDIATISWLRDQTRAGMTISQAVHLYRSRSADDAAPTVTAATSPVAFPELGRRREAGEPLAEDRLSRLREDVVATLVRFDALDASRVVEEALALLSVEDVCLHVLQPALYEIGRRWASGEIGVSVEHFASAFVIRKLGSLFNLSQPEHGRGPVIAACLEGELHEVGLLLTCLFLSRRGFRILYLGPNLPVEDLIDTVQRLLPPLVLLSASTPEAATELAAATREIKSRHIGDSPDDPPPVIGYGGFVFVEHPHLRQGIDGVFLGRDADEAIAAVEQVLSQDIVEHARPQIPVGDVDR